MAWLCIGDQMDKPKTTDDLIVGLRPLAISLVGRCPPHLREDAESVALLAMVEAVRDWNRNRPQATVVTYVRRAVGWAITRFLVRESAVTSCNNGAKLAQYRGEVGVPHEGDDGESILEAQQPTPEDEAIRNDVLAKVQAAKAALPNDEAMALDGKSPNTVTPARMRQRQRKARAKIKEALGV